MKKIVFGIMKYPLIIIAIVLIAIVSAVYLLVEILATVLGIDTDRWHDRNHYQK